MKELSEAETRLAGTPNRGTPLNDVLTGAEQRAVLNTAANPGQRANTPLGDKIFDKLPDVRDFVDEIRALTSDDWKRPG